MVSYYNEEQIITGYPIDGAMGLSGGKWVRKFSDVCLHNKAIVARGILVTNIALWDTRTASAPSILLVLLEPHSLQNWEPTVLVNYVALIGNHGIV